MNIEQERAELRRLCRARDEQRDGRLAALERAAKAEAAVAALRDALTELCDEIDKHEIHTALSKTSISWFKRKARAALAQGES